MTTRAKKATVSASKAKQRGLSPELMQLPESHAHRKGFVLRRKDVRESTKKARKYLTVRGIKPQMWELANLRVSEQVGNLIIPYFRPDGSRRNFHRTRQFGADLRFLQPSDTKPCLYWPPMPGRKGWLAWEQVLNDPSQAVFIVEGEIKAMALAQHGIATIAVGGVDAWRSKGKPIRDWGFLPLERRPLTLAFDADVVEKQHVQRALVQLGTYLKKQGAFVHVLVIPDLGDGVTGVDDIVAAHGITNFRKLAKNDTNPFEHPDFAHWGLAARNDTDWGFGQLLLEHHLNDVRYVKKHKGWLIWRDG